MAKLSLSLLGNFEAVLDERPFTQFRTNKVQALLIYLIVEAPTIHQRESLMELLWPGLPQKSAQVNLRQILYQLNKMVPDSVEEGDTAVSLLISDRKTVELHPHYPIHSDVTHLITLLQRIRQHSHHDLFTCLDCRTWLEEAVTLYQGDFLADFSLYDSNSFEAWAQIKRESLRRQTLDALDTLTHIHLAEQDYQQAEKTARQQLSIDNLRENAYRQLMKILALTGRRSEAMVHYEECQRLLIEELGMSPTAKTTALSEQIKGGSLSIVTPIRQGIRGYELGEKLGEGAFGAVYQATQKGIGRTVAIKIIHAKYANQPRFIRRFEAEAQIVARLEHPHIVPLYDYWREPDSAYLVMRWLRGGSLQTALEKELFTLETAVTLITQIANALHTAHRHGIIHRDVKPANILLDEEGNAYLSDFGIARDTTADLQLTRADELIGSPNYISPEQLLGEVVTPATDIYCLGVVLFKLLTGSQPFATTSMVELIQKQINEPLPLIAPQRPDLPADIDDIIQQATAKRAKDRFSNTQALVQALHQAVSGKIGRAITAMSPITTVSETDISNPYKGLRAFQEQDAAQFYGRQTLLKQLLTQLDPRHRVSSRNPISNATNRFLAVVGPSGSGKSSVIKAGLLPALRQGALPGSADWFIVEMTPGSYPLEELEAALLRVAVNPPRSLLEPLQKDERGLVRVLKRLLPQDKDVENPSQLLLVIDQFEELFTLVQKEVDRGRFLDNLFAALTEAHSRLWVIVTLRADFYDRPLQLPQLGEWMRERTELVLPLHTTELEEAIVAPAASMGVTLEPGLVSAIITDVKEQPGALPLMQYALTELFERRNGRLLTLAAYAAIGGVTGALARRAEEIYNHLDAPTQEATRQLFLRLITLGEGVEDTRRRMLISELQTLRVSETLRVLENVIGAYGRFRLLTFDHDPITRSATVEVAHEALLREWPRLRNWLVDSREDVRRQRLLTDSANQWKNAGQDNSYLLRGSRLVEFESWSETTTVALTANESDFLQTSIAARNQRHTEEEMRRQRELETSQKLAKEQARRAEEQTEAAQNLRRRAFILAGVSVLTVILAIAAFGFARSSNNNADLASTREAEALVNLDLAATNESNAIANANIASTREAEAAAERQAALSAQQQAEEAANFRATAEAVAVENQLIAEEQLRLTTSRELALAANANLEANPERSLLLGLTALDNAYTGEAEEVVRAALQASRVVLTLTEEGESIWWIDYHPDGDWLAGIGEEGITIWDTNNGDKLQTVPLVITTTNGLEISPDGSLLAVTSLNTIWILDTNSWEVINTLNGHTDIVFTIAFNPDSTLLASGSVDGDLKTWDLISGENQLTVLASDEGYATDVAFSRDGSRIATGGDDLTARIWDVTTGEELIRIVHDPTALWVNHVEFNADGTRLFTNPAGNSKRVVTVWDIETNSGSELTEPLAEWSISQSNLISKLALSSDGRYLAISSQDSTVILVDVTNLSGEEVLTLSGHRDSVNDIAFAPDGGKLASVSGGEVRI